MMCKNALLKGLIGARGILLCCSNCL